MAITTVPNAALLADESIPRATLAGIEWPMPKMTLAQLNVAVPILVSNTTEFTPARMLDLGSVVYMTLLRGHPDLKRADFNEWPITFMELLEAVKVVSNQTGMLKSKKAENGVAAIPLASTTSSTT